MDLKKAIENFLYVSAVKINEKLDKNLPVRLKSVVDDHITFGCALSLIILVPVPILDEVIVFILNIINIWTMYARINSCARIRFSVGVFFKTLFSGLVSNLMGSILSYILVYIMVALLQVIPRIGDFIGAILICFATATVIKSAAISYFVIMTKIFR